MMKLLNNRKRMVHEYLSCEDETTKEQISDCIDNDDYWTFCTIFPEEKDDWLNLAVLDDETLW